jgi:small basic protein
MLLFLVQPLLIVSGNRRVHMTLGKAGAVLAACVVFLGLQVGIQAARVNPADMKLWGLAPKQFMAIPVISILMFAGFVIAGVWNRRRPEVHRPMMLLAVLAVIPAAIDRIDAIQSLYRGTMWGTIFGPFFSMLVIGLFLLLVKRLVTGSWDRWLAMGYAGLVIASALIMQLATMSAWDHVAWLLLH